MWGHVGSGKEGTRARAWKLAATCADMRDREVGREGASRAEDWAASAGRGEKAGPRWAVREGKKGETAWAVRGLGLGRFGLKGWFLGWVWFLLLVFLSFSLFLILIQTQAKKNSNKFEFKL